MKLQKVSFKNGMTVKDLKELIRDWPEKDLYGEPTQVWITIGEGHTSICVNAIPLNYRMDIEEKKESADLLLKPSSNRHVLDIFPTDDLGEN